MLCYKDKWFCPFWADCQSKDQCDRPLRPEVKKQAKLWAKEFNLEHPPIEIITERPPCHLAMDRNQVYQDWLKLRHESEQEGEKLCYCGHTTKCTCSDPDLILFEQSVNNRTIILGDPDNGWFEGL